MEGTVSQRGQVTDLVQSVNEDKFLNSAQRLLVFIGTSSHNWTS